MEPMNYIECEKELGARIDSLSTESPDEAAALARELAQGAMKAELTAPQSAACARLICRFLLHRKNKNRLVSCIRESEAIRKAVFGCLNTYKHSLIYLFKRIIRENDCELTAEIIDLLQNNPYNDSAAKPYSDRWSARTVLEGALKVPEEYLSQGKQAAQLTEKALNNSDSLQ